MFMQFYACSHPWIVYSGVHNSFTILRIAVWSQPSSKSAKLSRWETWRYHRHQLMLGLNVSKHTIAWKILASNSSILVYSNSATVENLLWFIPNDEPSITPTKDQNLHGPADGRFPCDGKGARPFASRMRWLQRCSWWCWESLHGLPRDDPRSWILLVPKIKRRSRNGVTSVRPND